MSTITDTTEVADAAADNTDAAVETVTHVNFAETSIGETFGQIFSQTENEYAILLNLAILFGGVVAAYILSNLLMRKVVNRFVRAESGFGRSTFADSEVLKNLSRMLPWIILRIGINLVPYLNESFSRLIMNVATALAILYGMRMIISFMNAIIEYYTKQNNQKIRSIKSYVQLIKIFVYIISAILIIATLIDRSPVVLLSGLGAISAITGFIFQDLIKSFVAGLQISSNDMLRIGDWIEMPQVGADGTVIDIALQSVRVQNFDKTIVTVPTLKFTSDSYRNYRGMYDVNGRRIKRSLFIDLSSIVFMEKEDLERLSHINVLKDYLGDKLTEIKEHNSSVDNSDMHLNRRRLTNLGTFRAYAVAYLKAHPLIRQDLSLMVRQLQPTAEGIPLEVYAFTSTTDWVDYEGIQGDIFDHFYSVLPEFGLTPFQVPSGSDIVGRFNPKSPKVN